MNLRIVTFTLLALIAFAGNSLLCRAALVNTSIDPASFTSVRLISGALILWFLFKFRGVSEESKTEGSWISALALFVYAICFSFAYRHLGTAVGALILFAAVQITMISAGLWRGEKLHVLQFIGFGVSCAGLIVLLLPGLSAPPLGYATVMLCAGIAWGIYSLRGTLIKDALETTTNNFIKAMPLAILLNLFLFQQITFDFHGILYAITSGAIASGIGYAIWYSVLPHLKSTTAASLQLSVPVIAAVGGILFLDEPITLRLIATSLAILGGIALLIRKKLT